MSDDTSFLATDQSNFIDLAAQIVSAYVSNNRVSPTELPQLLLSMHDAVAGLGSPSAPGEAEADKLTPAQIRKSIRPEGLVSFIDGKTYQTLKRHLTRHGLDPAAYRARYGLPANYPSVAASYSERRSALAKNIGLGHQRRNAALDAAEAAVPPAKPKGRKKAAAAE
ncbi:MucR family transcriptional regulator [Methylobacterium sp. GC_Met_2]|uniref:MucR family transcriptional regulator n=1 Tax=Methylobacterium sp. GC_Met_2 TaxID=2937376 RepID=UPI00226B1489|nr:MucR family transcriptional regulator [Methylobacterium sp. GC_Met_2]